MGGGHRKANPKAGRKGPLRGDSRREEVAGRKRIGREYREKGPSHVPVEGETPYEEFTTREMNLLYAMVKRRAVGDKRPLVLDELLRVQRVTDDEREGFVSSFRRKCESRVWLTFYVGGDDMERAYINVGAWGTIRTYLDLHEP